MATPTQAPTPAAIADALAVAGMGGDLPRLAEVCRARAGHFEGADRERLLEAAEALAWTGRLVAALDAEKPPEDCHAGG